MLFVRRRQSKPYEPVDCRSMNVIKAKSRVYSSTGDSATQRYDGSYSLANLKRCYCKIQDQINGTDQHRF